MNCILVLVFLEKEKCNIDTSFDNETFIGHF